MSLDLQRSDYEWQWLGVKEESLLFDEILVNRKYNDLDESRKDEDTEQKNADREEKRQTQPDDSEIDLVYEAAGLVKVDTKEMTKQNGKAIHRWMKELQAACAVPTDVSSSYENSLKKRCMVQKFLHQIYLEEKSKRKYTKKQASAADNAASNVPVVVRLGVMTMFPLIEALSGVKEVNYQRLCTRTLDIVINIINSLPPLALYNEPSDCLDAFKDFIFKLLEGYGYTLDTPEKTRVMVALIGLALSRGGARNLLQVIDSLFKVRQKLEKCPSPKDDPPLEIGQFLQQLGDHQKDLQ